jgi:hypothetical protein
MRLLKKLAPAQVIADFRNKIGTSVTSRDVRVESPIGGEAEVTWTSNLVRV